MDESRLRNIRIYVVANEIGFIILWLLFLYLFRSDYGGIWFFMERNRTRWIPRGHIFTA